VYIRYAYRTTDGRQLHPTQLTLPNGTQVRGYPIFRWLESEAHAQAGSMLTGLGLDNQAVTVPVTALDFTAPVEAYAFTSEKIFYLRTNLVENFPSSVVQILRSKLENVPQATVAYLEQDRAQLEALAADIRAEGGEVTQNFAEHSREDIMQLLVRLIAFDNARAMLDISKILPPARIFANPMEPARLSTVILLRRDPADRLIASRLTMPQFMTALLIGETPDHKREVAYNAYRAVDDEAERAVIASMEQEVWNHRGALIAEELHRTFQRRADVPETLRQEFELFRVMHRTCTCYTVNTILTSDPLVKDRKEAVRLTIELIARLVDEQPQALRLALDTYRSFLTAPQVSSLADPGRRPS
jgi:hypothetical protein